MRSMTREIIPFLFCKVFKKKKNDFVLFFVENRFGTIFLFFAGFGTVNSDDSC